MKRQTRQAASAVLLVEPRHFGFNAETATSNRFQLPEALEPTELQRLALAEHRILANALRAAGIDVVVAEDSDVPAKPDAVFPNNWVSFHEDGTVILYPLEAPSRRLERRPELITCLERNGFCVSRRLDLSPLEARGQFLEGTGSLVLDHPGGVAYAALSSRTHADAVEEFGRHTKFETVTFHTRDALGHPLYHTNVMLSIGRTHAVICPAAIPHDDERRGVLDGLKGGGRTIVEIDQEQLRSFAANIIELEGSSGPVIAMSAAARATLRPAQLAVLEACARVVAVPIPVIERIGGGSVRCMLAEVFLPRREIKSSA